MRLVERQRSWNSRSTGNEVVFLVNLFVLAGLVQSSYAGFTCAGGYVSCPDKNVQVRLLNLQVLVTSFFVQPSSSSGGTKTEKSSFDAGAPWQSA